MKTLLNSIVQLFDPFHPTDPISGLVFPRALPIFATGTLRLIRGKEKMPERALPGWELLAGWSNSNSNFVSK